MISNKDVLMNFGTNIIIITLLIKTTDRPNSAVLELAYEGRFQDAERTMRRAQSVCKESREIRQLKIRQSFDQTPDGSGSELLTKGDIIMAKLVKVIEVLAQSEKSWDDAAQQAVSEASKRLRKIRSVYVKEFEAAVENGKITQYRINAKISFDLEESRAGVS